MASIPATSKDQSFLQKHSQKLIAATFWLAIGIAYFFYLQANDLTVRDSFKQITGILTTPFVGPIIYIILYAIHPIIFFPASILTIGGGALFGYWGILWVVIGANSAAMVAYVIGRFFGGNLVSEVSGDEKEPGKQGFVEKWKSRLQENSFETVLIMRFIFLPYNLVNYLCGFLKIDWKAFLLATALGSIAGTISFTLAGVSIGDINAVIDGQAPSLDWRVLLISAVIFAISMVISRYFKRQEPSE